MTRRFTRITQRTLKLKPGFVLDLGAAVRLPALVRRRDTEPPFGMVALAGASFAGHHHDDRKATGESGTVTSG